MQRFNIEYNTNCRISKWRIMNHKGGGDCIGRSHGGATCVRERGGKKRE